MQPPHPPLGLLARVFGWFSDLAKAPGRIRVLAEQKAAESDPRRVCPSCGKGRIGDLTRIANDANWCAGTCDACGKRFYVAQHGGELGGLLADQG